MSATKFRVALIFFKEKHFFFQQNYYNFVK